MDHKVFLLSTGYSLHSLIQKNAGLCAQFEFLGIDFRNEAQLTDRQQLIKQLGPALQDNRFVLIMDGAPQMNVREILAQGFHKPLRQDDKIYEDIKTCLQRQGRESDFDERETLIPKEALALSAPDCPQAGFVLFYPNTCVAYLPGEPQTALRLLANELYPRLLRNLYSGAVMEDIPICKDKLEVLQDYLARIKRRPKHFLALLGGSRENPVLRMIAIKAERSDSEKCCNSFLEDVVCECGKISLIPGIGRKGLDALDKYRRKKGIPTSVFSREGQDFDEFSQKLDAELPVNQQSQSVSIQNNFLSTSDLEDEMDDTDFPEDFFEEKRERTSSRRNNETSSSFNNYMMENDSFLEEEPFPPQEESRIAPVKKKEGTKTKRSPLIKILLVICIMVFSGSALYLGQYYWKSAQNKSTYESLREVYDRPTLIAPQGYPSGYDKDLAALWELNHDTVGWINIEGTQLDYPVMQTDDNQKYYRTNFEGKYSEHAVPFVDASVDLKAPSDNIIIYGHNIRADGQMFNILKNYKDIEFYKEHPTVKFHSVYHENEYKIFSVFYANTRSEHGKVFPYHEFIDGANKQEIQNYIDEVKVRSILDTGVDVKPSDELLTLSTCSYEFKDARYVVVARKLRFGEKANSDVEKAKVNPQPLYPDVWYQLFGGTKPEKTAKAEIPVENEIRTMKQETREPVLNVQEILSEEEVIPQELFKELDDKQAPPIPKIVSEPEPAVQKEPQQTIPQAQAASVSVQEESVKEEPKPKKEKPKKLKKEEPKEEKTEELPSEIPEKEELPKEPPVENDQKDAEQEKHQETNREDIWSGENEENTLPIPQPEQEAEQEPESFSFANAAQTLSVTYNGKKITDSASKIVGCIVSAEMGSSFEPEALKAQAVAAYTYVLYHNNKGTSPGVVMKDEVAPKVQNAVDSVIGQTICYNGAPINATYCASNAGRSNDAKTVWGSYFPYLVSVDSPGDTTLKAYGATKVFSEQEIADAIESYCNVDPYDYADPSNWFEDPQYVNGNYVDTISVCGQSVNGRDVREKMLHSKIASPAFTVSYENGDFVFTTYGYGHGVGMSQQGADYFAKQGWNYQQILTHYYSNTTIH